MEVNKMAKILDIEVTDNEWGYLMEEQAKGKELKVINGKVVAVKHEPTEKELAEQRIQELKQLLANTDYKAIKYAEGELPYTEYESTRKQRREWRAEINRLEPQLNG